MRRFLFPLGGNGAVCAVASGGNGAARTADEVETGVGAGSVDVSSTCVNPVFRSFPNLKEGDGNEDGPGGRTAVRVLFLSEGNVCRSVVAEAVLTAMVREKGLEDYIVCSSKAVRDYNVGESPDSRVVQLAGQSGVAVDAARQAQLLRPAEDVVAHDLLVVMDKFNAADVLKEVSVFDTIDPTARFSSKVRRMGDFCKSRTVDDIDDPLYGNMGGPEELELLGAAINDIVDCCDGLLTDLIAIRAALAEGESFRNHRVALALILNRLSVALPPPPITHFVAVTRASNRPPSPLPSPSPSRSPLTSRRHSSLVALPHSCRQFAIPSPFLSLAALPVSRRPSSPVALLLSPPAALASHRDRVPTTLPSPSVLDPVASLSPIPFRRPHSLPCLSVALVLSPPFPPPSLSPLPFRRPRSLSSLSVALALSPPFQLPLLSPLPFRRPRSLPSLSVALVLSPPFPPPSLSPLPFRRPRSLSSLSVALALSPPFQLPLLSPLPFRRPRSLPSLSVALVLSPPFPSPSLSLIPFRRPRSLPSLSAALILSPPFPPPSLSPLPFRRPRSLPSLSVDPCSLPSLSVALALSPPFPSPSLSLIPFRRPRSLPSFPSPSFSPLPFVLAISPSIPSIAPWTAAVSVSRKGCSTSAVPRAFSGDCSDPPRGLTCGAGKKPAEGVALSGEGERGVAGLPSDTSRLSDSVLDAGSVREGDSELGSDSALESDLGPTPPGTLTKSASVPEIAAEVAAKIAAESTAGSGVLVEMDVVRANFEEGLAALEAALKTCDLVAFDGEFTGLHVSNTSNYGLQLLDSPQQRYERVKEGAGSFFTMQLGFSALTWDEARAAYSARTFNFNIFPRPFPGFDLRFLCQASSMDFLARNNFDFNKFVYQGVPYLPLEKAERERRRLRASFRSSKGGAENGAGSADASSSRQVQQQRAPIVLSRPEDRLAVGQLLDDVRTWVLSTSPPPTHLASLSSPAAAAAGGAGGAANGKAGAASGEAVTKQGAAGEAGRGEAVGAAAEGKGEGEEHGAVQLQVVVGNSFLRAALLQQLEEEFGQTAFYVVRGEVRRCAAEVRPQRGPETLLLVRATQEDAEEWGRQEEQRQQQQLESSIGFTRAVEAVMRVSRERRVPLLAHNCLFDLAYLFHHFIRPMPDSLDDWRRQFLEAFPGGVYDTKHLVSLLPPALLPPSTSLSSLFEFFFHRPASPPSTPVGHKEVVHGEGFNRYRHLSPDNPAMAHEAGFDAYMTAAVFIAISSLLASPTLSAK
ncbi:unnamed protein product, partial [Closterium sp. Yama58-4]